MLFLLIDDHTLFREGLALVLRELNPRIRILHASDAIGAKAALARAGDIRLVLLDLALGNSSGLDLIPVLHQARPGLPIVVLSGSIERHVILAAIDAGAMGYIPKVSSSKQTLDALRQVLNGQIFVPSIILKDEQANEPNLARSEEFHKPLNAAGTATSAFGLTPRQTAVMQLILQGMSSKRIGEELEISDNTVKAHTTAIFRSFRVTTRTQLVITISRSGVTLPLLLSAP